ncbi:MAG: ribonuclease PH [Candidatus Margulisiibacteriota bacterium]
MKRADGRRPDQIRPVKITRNYLKHPQGSVLIEMGDTKVICSAFVDENVPPFRKGKKGGWVTAEYSMLPGATSTRSSREHGQGRAKGRTHEIQRLIGRSLRGVVDFKKLGERTIYLDADVIQADGGTRTASITGCFIALKDAVAWLLKKKKIKKDPVKEYLAAVSVGIVKGRALLDLMYSEDFSAAVDMNVVMTEKGELVEIQGTAEGTPFSEKQLFELLALAKSGIKQLIIIQKQVLQ